MPFPLRDVRSQDNVEPRLSRASEPNRPAQISAEGCTAHKLRADSRGSSRRPARSVGCDPLESQARSRRAHTRGHAPGR